MSGERGFTSKARGLCVLLLEDDDADAYLTGRALLGLPRVGEVVRLRNGQEAVTQLSGGRLQPDLAFVDLQMPTMNGLDFLATCMDQNLANVPMVVLTSSSDRKDVLRSRVHGALRVITKPEDPAELKRLLHEAIEALVPDPEAEAKGAAAAWPAPPTAAPVQYAPRAPERPAAAAFGRRQSRPGA